MAIPPDWGFAGNLALLQNESASEVFLHERGHVQDDEGNFISGYSDEAIPVQMTISAMNENTDVQTYGDKVMNMKVGKTISNSINEFANENDGISLDGENVVYRIVSIRTLRTHKRVILERK
ncbi:hypothetical protein EQG49_02315 [Periweissella cryptocerci]|uniref:Uncharacterized protein n=1 Tax=Periweissella cryptocerci TaxID=2506420 RepID=A0A4P6YRW4_9LACO|nr:hypothetical protein [Periweissella cryptocerci]QBO35381.1 hypothetical protein EQG49_02315 [Periweissella cryptocerci]